MKDPCFFVLCTLGQSLYITWLTPVQNSKKQKTWAEKTKRSLVVLPLLWRWKCWTANDGCFDFSTYAKEIKGFSSSYWFGAPEARSLKNFHSFKKLEFNYPRTRVSVWAPSYSARAKLIKFLKSAMFEFLSFTICYDVTFIG